MWNNTSLHNHALIIQIHFYLSPSRYTTRWHMYCRTEANERIQCSTSEHYCSREAGSKILVCILQKGMRNWFNFLKGVNWSHIRATLAIRTHLFTFLCRKEFDQSLVLLVCKQWFDTTLCSTFCCIALLLLLITITSTTTSSRWWWWQ